MDLGFLVHFTRWLFENAEALGLGTLVKLTPVFQDLDKIMELSKPVIQPLAG